MAVVMIPMHIRFVVCGELTIPHLGLIYYCFYKRKIAMRNLGRPSRSDFVQLELYRKVSYPDICKTPSKYKPIEDTIRDKILPTRWMKYIKNSG